MRGSVAFFARNARVLAFQIVARQAMVELFLGRLPMNEAEICSVVFEMATDAILAIGISHLQLGMIPVLGGKSTRHFLVTIEALKDRSAGSKLVAARALQGSR